MRKYPLLLIPGMMCDARLFAPQIAAINDRALMVTPIIAHDNMADLGAEMLDHAPPQFILGGLSMGGIVAMEVLRQAPERIKGLILMDTNPLAELDEIKARRAPQIKAVRAGNLDMVMREQMIPHYLHRDYPNPALELLAMDMARGLGADVFEKQSLALRNRRDQSETLRTYKGPCLILHGEDDRLTPAHRHDLMHSYMPHARYEIISKAGHLSTLEQPDRVNSVFQSWLSHS